MADAIPANTQSPKEKPKQKDIVKARQVTTKGTMKRELKDGTVVKYN